MDTDESEDSNDEEEEEEKEEEEDIDYEAMREAVDAIQMFTPAMQTMLMMCAALGEKMQDGEDEDSDEDMKDEDDEEVVVDDSIGEVLDDVPAEDKEELMWCMLATALMSGEYSVSDGGAQGTDKRFKYIPFDKFMHARGVR